MTYKVSFEFDTQEQCLEFASWYSGQGEQDIDVWLECSGDLDGATVKGYDWNEARDTLEVTLALSYKEDE